MPQRTRDYFLASSCRPEVERKTGEEERNEGRGGGDKRGEGKECGEGLWRRVGEGCGEGAWGRGVGKVSGGGLWGRAVGKECEERGMRAA